MNTTMKVSMDEGEIIEACHQYLIRAGFVLDPSRKSRLLALTIVEKSIVGDFPVLPTNTPPQPPAAPVEKEPT